jgi:PIN domain nuclease of toxin-antitoxin system
MNLLLDTHIWLWSVLEPERLSRRVAKEIQDVSNELWLSPISVWELIVLWQKRRLIPGEDIEGWVPRLQLSTRDPADRFLLATAKVFELTLVTADEHLLKTRDVPLLADR